MVNNDDAADYMDNLWEMRRQNAQALSRRYPSPDINESARSMIYDKGLYPSEVKPDFSGVIKSSEVPLTPAAIEGLKRDDGITKAVKDPNAPDGYMTHVFVNPSLPQSEQLSVLNHELQHASDIDQGIAPQPTADNQSNQNVNPHFASDYPGQMLDYQGRNSVALGAQDLQDFNLSNNIGLLNNYGPNGQAMQTALTQKQQQLSSQ